MSKKVLILSGSPRKGGNSDLLCDEFLRGALDAGNQAEKIFLRSKKVAPCNACYSCSQNGGQCAIRDDMAEILDKIQAADVIVMASPVYFYSINAQMKGRHRGKGRLRGRRGQRYPLYAGSLRAGQGGINMEYVTLSNGVKMPILGYGVYQVTPDQCERCVLDALEVGYRSIDTAQSYFNEEQVGSAVQKSGVPRKELFLTTKVWIEHYGYEPAKASVLRSMEKLQTDYLDLVLLHQPFSDTYGAWRALEELYEAGKIRAIGISNFYADRMVDFASFNRIKPMVNQVEAHIFDQQKTAKEWMDKYGVQIEAWAPFGEGRGGIFENPVIADIAAKHRKTPAQVMLRWHIQRGVVVIPKSTHKERMEENFQVFDFALTDEDMLAISALDKGESAFFSHQDPAMVEWFVRMVEERKTHQ